MFGARSRFACVFALTTALVACSTAERRDGFDEDPNAVGSSSGGSGDGTGTGGIGGGGASGGPSVDTSNRTRVRGVTYAPNGTLPLGNTLVYWSLVEPAPIPAEVYCDACVELPEGTLAFSGADGRYELDVPTGVPVYIVTQKGQFRRVKQVTLEPGATSFGADGDKVTTLPGVTGAGDTVPKIAVLSRETDIMYDVIWEALEKLGVDEYTIVGSTGFTTNVAELKRYHLVMLNCGSGNAAPSGAAAALREYAAAGGKVYVSDYAQRYITQAFPQVTTITTGEEFEAPGRFVDPGLDAWMNATGSSNPQFEGVWTTMSTPKPALMQFPDGSTNEVVPKIWTEMQHGGGWQTASYSLQYGCGRGMFSTFHAHASGNALAPQEKALLYMLLEVSACVEPGPGVQ